MANIPDIIHESWIPHLEPLFQLRSMKLLHDEILIHGTFYPEPHNIFRVFRMPLHEIKVVMLGQDPYPKRGQAVGLAFAVPPTTYMPATLKVIREELINEFDSYISYPFNYLNIKQWQTLNHWVNQGVFLFNCALTVQRGISGSHNEYWEEFTSSVIGIIAKEVKPIWCLWGSHARDMGTYIFEHHPPERPRGAPDNRTLSAPHPAAGAYNKNQPNKFIGCGHFKKINDILVSIGKEPINW